MIIASILRIRLLGAVPGFLLFFFGIVVPEIGVCVEAAPANHVWDLSRSMPWQSRLLTDSGITNEQP
jgi:hypothetical protein